MATYKSDITDNEGKFKIGGLKGTGGIWVVVSKSGYATINDNLKDGDHNKTYSMSEAHYLDIPKSDR